MTDDLTRLIDLPALARLSIAGDEIALLTLTHEHADKISIERRKLGASIDLGDLLQLIGAHGLAELPPSAIQVTEVPAPRLQAPVEAADAPLPTARRTTKHQAPAPPVVPVPEPAAPAVTVPTHACSECTRMFISGRALGIHLAMTHKSETPKQVEARTTGTETSANRVPCPHCASSYDPRGLGMHIRKVHTAAPEPPVPEPPTVADVHACPDCPRTFRSQNALDNHMAMIHWQNDVAAPVVQTEGICDVCQRPEGLHDRCIDCGMLLGDEHTAGPVHIRINGTPLCASCDAYRSAGRLMRAS